MTVQQENNMSSKEFQIPPSSKQISKIRKVLPQILAVSVKNLLLFGYGMTLGFPTILIPKLSGDDPDEVIRLNQESISWIGSSSYLCVPLGCLFSGVITQPLGRRRAMQLINLPILAAWLLFYFATERWHLYFALCLTGLAGGLCEAPAITYLSEVTTPDLRGVLGSITSVSVIGGMLLQIIMGTVFHWKSVALGSCVMPVLSIIFLFFVPESPHWLVMKKKMQRAQDSLAWLRGWVPVENIRKEFDELVYEIQNGDRKVEKPTVKNFPNRVKHFKESAKLYTKKDFLWPFALVSFCFFLGHFSGITMLHTYAVNIFATLRSPIDKYYATIVLASAQVLGCISNSSLVHFTGKRKVNFLSVLGCGTCFFVVATYAYVNDIRFLELASTTNSEEQKSWLPMLFLITGAFFASAGIKILPWMLIGEVYHNEIRASASGFSGAMSYVFGFLANKTFFTLINFLTLPGLLWLCSSVSFFGFAVLFFTLPETERKTLFEVTQHFAGKEKLSNKVKPKKVKNQEENDKYEVYKNGQINAAYVKDKSDGEDVVIRM